MVALLQQFLRRYHRPLVVVTVLLLLKALGNLFLPALNADIINNGVAQGDAAYILRVGSWMRAVSLVVAVAAVIATYYSARTARPSDATSEVRCSRPWRCSLGRTSTTSGHQPS